MVTLSADRTTDVKPSASSVTLQSMDAHVGYELHVVHVRPAHKNMMNHADEDYREAGVKAPHAKQHKGRATDMVWKLSPASPAPTQAAAVSCLVKSAIALKLHQT